MKKRGIGKYSQLLYICYTHFTDDRRMADQYRIEQ